MVPDETTESDGDARTPGDDEGPAPSDGERFGQEQIDELVHARRASSAKKDDYAFELQDDSLSTGEHPPVKSSTYRLDESADPESVESTHERFDQSTLDMLSAARRTREADELPFELEAADHYPPQPIEAAPEEQPEERNPEETAVAASAEYETEDELNETPAAEEAVLEEIELAPQDAPSITTTGETSSVVDPSELEALVEEAEKETGEEELGAVARAGTVEGEVEGSGDDEALSEDALDSLLDSADLDSDLTEAESDRSVVPSSADELGTVDDEPSDELPAGLVDSLVQESKQSVGAENIAAAASERLIESEQDVVVGDENPEATRRRRPSGSSAPEEETEIEVFSAARGLRSAAAAVIAYFSRSRAKLAASLGAGAAVFVITFIVLVLNQYGSGLVDTARDLESAMARAEGLMENNQPREAYELLEEVLPRYADHPQRPDAEYLQLEALYRMLTVAATPRDTAVFHGQADEVLQGSPNHPRAPEAALWRAEVYVREGDLYSAQQTLSTAITAHDESPMLDRLLVAASKLALENEQPKRAANYLQRVLYEFPQSPETTEANLLLGDAYAAAGRIEEARILYIRATERHGFTAYGADAVARLGELEYSVGNYSRAIHELERRLARATSVEGNDGVYLALARAYRGAGELEKARTTLTELLEFFPETDKTAEASVEMAFILEDLGHQQDAARAARQNIDRFPKNPFVLSRSAEILARDGAALDAAEAYWAAVQAGGNDPNDLLSAGLQYEKAGDLERAFESFDMLSYRYPRSDTAFEGAIGMGRVLFAQGRVSKAVERLENLAMATRGKKQRLPVLAALGELYAELGMDERAAEVFAEIATSTTEPELLAKASRALADAGALEESANVAARVDPARLQEKTAYEFLVNYGKTLLQMHRIDEGLDAVESAHGNFPEHRTSQGYQELLHAYLASDRRARARALVTELRGQVIQDQLEENVLWTAANAWGDYLYERGDYRGAADAFAMTVDSAEESRPEWQWATYQRANALMKLSRFDEGIQLYDKVASMSAPWSSDAETQAAYARLELKLRGQAPDE